MWDMAAGPNGRGHGRMLSEIRSDVADHGSIISDRDEAQKTGSVGCLPLHIALRVPIHCLSVRPCLIEDIVHRSRSISEQRQAHVCYT